MLKVENLFLKKGSFTLGELSFEVEKNSYFIILGKTGSGKTMLLESIAGIQKTEGKIYCGDREISSLLPEERNFGFVYQDFALFPNMNVKENITFSSRYKKIEKSEELLKDLVDFLGIEKLLKRTVLNLSGGEKQRVAIARAIYSRPRVLLLDEPLSAVDPTFRNHIMKSLKDIVKRYDTTILHVTHNFREASYLGDKIAVMLEGKILQIGEADEVLNKPTSIEVAKFLGFKNIFPVSLIGIENGKSYFSIDPNKILFSHKKHEGEFVFECVIDKVMGISDHYKVFAKVNGMTFFAKVPKNMFDRLKLKEGMKAYMYINRKDVAFI